MAGPLKPTLVDKSTGEKLEVQFVDGPDIDDEIVPGWVDARIIGGTHPRISYAGGGGRIWTFKAVFHREDDDDSYVINQVLWLQSRLLPEYNAAGAMVAPPHLCLFTWGDLFSAQVVIRQAKAKYSKTYAPDTLLPIFAEVQLRLDEYELGSRGFEKLSPTGGR